ncbi:MAG: hypothetical protein PHI12_07600 [Dehalococcoidales bacterium]|nr:hypothetical protein [Dehalococcoidales bacterium]
MTDNIDLSKIRPEVQRADPFAPMPPGFVLTPAEAIYLIDKAQRMAKLGMSPESRKRRG